MIVEYERKYNNEVKNLLLELQQYLASIDREGYNIVGEGYKDKYFLKTMRLIKKCNGKMLLYIENGIVAGLVVGVVNNDACINYEFKAPKRGRVTELIVKKEYRGKNIGKQLLDAIKGYLKSINCEKIMIAVFGYNEGAINFYKKNGYHFRMIDMIEN